MSGLIRRYPLTAFFLLAYALGWACVLFIRVSLAFAFLGLFAPAAAALIVSGVEGNAAAVRRLLAKVGEWRARPIWYAAALGLPFLLTYLATRLCHASVCAPAPAEMSLALTGASR
jgi:hypothetical protein